MKYRLTFCYGLFCLAFFGCLSESQINPIEIPNGGNYMENTPMPAPFSKKDYGNSLPIGPSEPRPLGDGSPPECGCFLQFTQLPPVISHWILASIETPCNSDQTLTDPFIFRHDFPEDNQYNYPPQILTQQFALENIEQVQQGEIEFAFFAISGGTLTNAYDFGVWFASSPKPCNVVTNSTTIKFTVECYDGNSPVADLREYTLIANEKEVDYCIDFTAFVDRVCIPILACVPDTTTEIPTTDNP